MKPVRMGAVLLALGALAACDNLFSPKPAPGTFQGQWDGAAWQADAYAVRLDGGFLMVEAHRADPKYYHDEYARVSVPFTGPGTYTIPPGEGFLAQIDGGDAGIFGGAGGTLVITGYDAASRTIAGELQLDAQAPISWHVIGAFTGPVYSRASDIPQTKRLWWSPGPVKQSRR